MVAIKIPSFLYMGSSLGTILSWREDFGFSRSWKENECESYPWTDLKTKMFWCFDVLMPRKT